MRLFHGELRQRERFQGMGKKDKKKKIFIIIGCRGCYCARSQLAPQSNYFVNSAVDNKFSSSTIWYYFCFDLYMIIRYICSLRQTEKKKRQRQ